MENKRLPGFETFGPHFSQTTPKDKHPAQNHRNTLPPVKKGPMTKQKGLYSDVFTTLRFKTCAEEADAQERLSSSDYSDYDDSEDTSSKSPFAKYKFDDKEYYGTFSKQLLTTYFNRGGDTPKVQMPFKTVPGRSPRDLTKERRRREYLKIDFERLLKEKKIDSNLLMPRPLDNNDEQLTVSCYLPLEIFDNVEFDCRTAEDWMVLGKIEGSPFKKPIPAKALLPSDDRVSFDHRQAPSLFHYSWHLVGVLDYNKEKCQYLVEKVFPNSNLKESQHNCPDVNCLLTGNRHWIPRIRLLFSAEDPRVFVERIQFAMYLRARSEALILYHLTVDCMPIWNETPSIDPQCLYRIQSRALSGSGLKLDIVKKCIEGLAKEVKLEYDRTMNRFILDKSVTSHPHEFSHIVVPQKEPERVPLKGCVTVPAFDYKKNRAAFLAKSMLTEPKVIYTLSEIRSECNKLSTMKLFNVSLTKPMRLDEFEANQTQMQTQISLFLREAWMLTVTYSLRHNLETIGKGAYNMNETHWGMHKVSKLNKLLAVVHYNLQDTLRNLVEDSLLCLSKLILDACCSVLTCPDELVWGDDYITSPYKPKNKPLFLVDLILNETGVHYSTSLENFEETIINLFNEGILVTHNIPMLDKFLMKKLLFGDEPVLESVHLCEPKVSQLREKICTALKKAVIPLKAYAAEYTKYIELYSLNMEEHFLPIGEDDKPSKVVKEEVEQHLNDKETLQNSLPSSIIIGAFIVHVEGVRQTLINKKKALAIATLEHHAEKLRKQMDDECDEFCTVGQTLGERLNSIEDLTEKRDWMKQIPSQLKSCKERVAKILAEYELFDEFNYPLSNEDFTKKWRAIEWPQKILSQIDDVTANLVQEEERFQKIQIADQDIFEQRIEAVEMMVGKFIGYADVDHATEMANDVKRTSKELKECQALAQTYNTRERLFGTPVTNYDRLHKMAKQFQPFFDLWTTTFDWTNRVESWRNDPLTSIDPELLERNVAGAFDTMNKCIKQFKDKPDCKMVAELIRAKIEEFRPYVPLIQGLRNPGMRMHHWESLSDTIGIKVVPQAKLTLSRCLEIGLQNHMDVIAQVAETAGKEYTIEQALNKMKLEWSEILFELMAYKDTGTYIMKSPDEALQLLDDHIVMTQSMSFSPYKKAFEADINKWESKLRTTQDVLEEWLLCQGSWLYLEPIFSSDDINEQLPEEGKRYQQMEEIWKRIMKGAFDNPKIIEFCPGPHLLDKLKKCNVLLELVQKGLSEYLEIKRNAFPRFYFLSDDELLEILSQTKDATAVQPHLRKCFENIARLKFQEDLLITHMYSGEGEEVKLSVTVMPSGNVEDWLRLVERSMTATVRDYVDRSLKVYPEQPREDWVLSWPGQVVIAGCQVYWTAEVSEALEQGDLADRLFPQLQKQLGNLVQLVRSGVSKMQRAVLSALIVIEVHAKDVAAKLVDLAVLSVNDFEWISQLRYYWAREDLYIRAVNAEFLYGYEYLGNSGRLVITPLTDKCYLTLTGALHLKFGGAPAGPAGTGKTETTKDLGKALAIQTVVFNCSDQLDFMAMGKFLKGLASSGAWACFDEFNRIDVEVLSVVAQQITTIQKAQQQRAERFIFEGSEIPLVPSCAVFITMNPGYAGRTELPDNLKALFRPVAMMVPNFAMIAEISLYSFGFSDAKVLSQKITSTFTLSSEQLSSQDHYDFGMRSVKSVISAAGNLKRENPNMNEELICLRAIKDVNVPKFLRDDLKLFNGIVSDLFPKTKQEPIDYGTLEESMRNICMKMNLKDVDEYIGKCIQLYETTVVRHGLMLVGPSGSGKTKCYEVLGAALTALKGQPSASGDQYEAVQTYVLNPKSITMGQLYGEYDLLTHEWTDGILSSLIRMGTSVMDNDKKWYMFDGPVDAVWIENMNTVLDDNKKLCLSSGEIIKLTECMTMMFEVQDLAVASPATVSRCGMIYLEPSILGLVPFTECWLRQVPKIMKPFTEQLASLFERFLQDSVNFVRASVKEIITSLDSNLTCSLLKLMDCFFMPFKSCENEKTPQRGKLEHVKDLIEPWFIFSLVWSVGATGDGSSRQRYSAWLRHKMSEEKITLCFPEEGLVYDYRLDDAGISRWNEQEEEDRKVQWVNWVNDAKDVDITPDTSYSDIIVPTADTVRMTFLMDMLLSNMKPLLCIGPTGTGKTLALSDKLLKNMHQKFVTHFLMFSARTSANQTQDFIDSKLDKRRKGVFAPPKGKFFIFFIDDLNMPLLETYGAQPPIELLRQWMDHTGWYDRKMIGSFKQIVDINFACAMGPPGGGRNPITPRFTRHFSFLSFTELEDASMTKIFSTILGSWMNGKMSKKNPGRTVPEIIPLNNAIVSVTIRVYATICSQLLPTPTKSHYTFNLRDLSKVFQGILMAETCMIENKDMLLRLWYHENCRVFQDRLVCAEDREWFNSLLKEFIQEFGCDFDVVVPCQPVIYGDFMVPGALHKVYTFIDDKDKLEEVMMEYMEDYNQNCTPKMKLVLFMDAIEHVCRIARVLRQPLGNALLLGVGGSGRQSLTKLASYISEYKCFQIELSKNYGQLEWREDIKSIMMKAGIHNQQITFLFVDTQIKSESFLEDINSILNSGDVPNLYASDEQERILASMKPVVQELALQPTKPNLMAAYLKRVRTNIHTVLCMSPIGEVFRARLRQFPSLVTCCTIDWFSAWPDEALQAVATSFLNELYELEASPEVLSGLTVMCMNIHQMVAQKCLQFMAELSRQNYVTPKSYLELLNIFSNLIGRKKQELCSARERMRTGLDKLLSTAEDVSKMQEEQEVMRPLLEEAARETEVTMETIKKDSVIAEETQKSVQAEEVKASEKARVAGEIATDAQRDLDEALPALDAATASLKSLNKNDVTEVRAMQRPPAGVKLVIEAVCIMRDVKPKKVPGEKPGSKIDDYWEPGKVLLQDPGKFLDSLFAYDKENIPERVIALVQPYIDNEEFQPAAIAKVSKACTSICQWVRAMHLYHFVAKGVEPKRQALKAAQEEYDESQRSLKAAKEMQAAVESGIALLQAKYQDCLAKKNELDNKYQLCEIRLVRADKLIAGLADEKTRWKETVQHLEYMVNNVAGDVLLSAGYVSYLGPFTGSYRAAMAEEWLRSFKELGVPHTDAPSLMSTLGDPVKIRSWQLSGLPKDTLSVENSVIAQYSLRWALFIDPQGQANSWIKSMERDSGLEIIKLSDRDFLRSLENAIRFGKPCLLENIEEDMDPSLEPVLLQQTFKEQGSLKLKLGDNTIPYHESFKFYITTKLPNPHYSPEVSTKVTLINFTLSPSGLEDQLLAQVVAAERPELETAKNQLIVSNAKMKQELKDIEDEILYRLSSSEGNPVDNEELIQVLEASKVKAGEIQAKVLVAEETEKDIDTTRLTYVPVAVRTQILFFCVSDLSNVDPMYQYSLEWFLGIFMVGIANAKRADTVEERIENINEYFTFSLYCNVCRSLFEKHKLMFAFLVCARILTNDGEINMAEWRNLLSGGMPNQELPNPAVSWLSDRAWKDILGLSVLETYKDLASTFDQHLPGFKNIFDSNIPHREPLPGKWNTTLDQFQKLLVLRCLRADCLVQGIQDFVALKLGQRFIEPQTSDLAVVFKESSPSSPLIFILSPGTDPASDLYKFADVMHFSKKITAISLGQGQGPLAEALMRTAMERGQWVFFQNCHLAPSWMPSLETLIENIDLKVHKDFRLWLTSLPSNRFPVSILQNGTKMTIELPKGIKANLQKTYLKLTNDFINSSNKVSHLKSLLLSLCLFHGIALERRKFGPLGFNIPYEFTDGDLNICISQLKMFLDEYDNIPYKVLKYTAGEINYGGRVTDEWDRRCLLSVLEDFYCPAVLSEEHIYSESGVYRQIETNVDIKGYLTYVHSLPINDTPEIFGLHDNANISFAQNETFTLLGTLLRLQPRTASGGGQTLEEIVEEIVAGIVVKIPKPFDIQDVVEKYPVLYEESMNTVLMQEIIRYNNLLEVIAHSLVDIVKALKGLVVMSSELERMANSLFNNGVPDMWKAKAYPSLKPLASWVSDLLQRVHFLQRWILNGIPPVFWISGFYFPQAFLTGTLQNYARRFGISIDIIGFDFQVVLKPVCDINEKPDTGCYISGLFIEGARWDNDTAQLTESRAKELYTEMAAIWLIPMPNRKPPTAGIYICPIYKTLTRAGTLSTTGHSTNYVIAVELPTDLTPGHWIKRGVALICALDY
ncbi:dynein axonemal heavy chain 1 [Syngnathus scovelli]|uniref:dynein axonemal heavy chain 1 n=1 Tax=Syngnathus scovelli TaxID=161590 RepID=UPI00210F849A|nr:dynein axonemal heavy chain 1 [Syngnathus scovelli]